MMQAGVGGHGRVVEDRKRAEARILLLLHVHCISAGSDTRW